METSTRNALLLGVAGLGLIGMASVRRGSRSTSDLDAAHLAIYHRIAQDPPRSWAKGAGVKWNPLSLMADFRGDLHEVVRVPEAKHLGMTWRDEEQAELLRRRLLEDGVIHVRYAARREEQNVYAWGRAPGVPDEGARGSAARSRTESSFPRHWAKRDPKARVVLYRGQPAPVYPIQDLTSRLSTEIPFVPTGKVSVEKREGGPFGTRRAIYVLHEGELPENVASRRDRLPNTLIEAWVERGEGKYVASQSWLGDRTYVHPPTKAEFDAAWKAGALPARGTRVPPERPVARRYTGR